MAFINLTPHDILVFKKNQFVNLVEKNPTTWVADDVQGDAILSLPSMGSVRIATCITSLDDVHGIPVFATQYGELIFTGIDQSNINSNDILIVSLPVVSNAKAAGYQIATQLVSPYQVVRLASDTSIILGCTGFTL